MGINLFRLIRIIISSALLLTLSCFSVNAKDMKVTVNSYHITNVQPKTVNGIVYIPLNPVFKALGWKVQWGVKPETITCTKEKSIIEFWPGSIQYSIDGQDAVLSAPVVLMENKSYLPRKYITQQFGVKIRWNKKDNLIIVSDTDASITINGGSNIVLAGNGIIVNIFEPCSKETLNDMMNYADKILSLGQSGEALDRYKEILDNLSQEEMPDMYARVMNNIGNAYSMMADVKNTRSNILNAIRSYQKAVGFYKENDDVANYSIIMNNLGNAYSVLSDLVGDKVHMEMAVEQYKEALKFYTPGKYPLDYAFLQYNTGKAYYELGLIERAKQCCLDAESEYKKALDIYTLDQNPAFYALIQFNLGNLYYIFLEGARTEDFAGKAKERYKEALRVWTVESYPMNYAKVHRSLGNTHMKLYEVGKKPEDFQQAKAEYEESLRFYSIGRYPLQYAEICYTLGNLYTGAARINGGGKYPAEAVTAYGNSMKVFDSFEHPKYYHLATLRLEKVKRQELF